MFRFRQKSEMSADGQKIAGELLHLDHAKFLFETPSTCDLDAHVFVTISIDRALRSPLPAKPDPSFRRRYG